MSVPARCVARCSGDFDRLFASLVAQNPAMGRRFADARRSGDWLASPLPRFAVRRAWPQNVVPLGNAAAALEPIGGEGMGLALRSAELAAAALIEAQRQAIPLDQQKLRRQFARLWRVRRFACRAAAMAVSAPRIAVTIAPLIDSSPPLGKIALSLIGKSA